MHRSLSLFRVVTTLASKQQFRSYAASNILRNNATQENFTHEEATNTIKEASPLGTTPEEVTNIIKETPSLETTHSEKIHENSNAGPVTPRRSFAERAKAGFPKRAQPSEMAKNWERPTEKLQTFVPPDLGQIGTISRFVEIRNLPLTVIPHDVQMMAADVPIVEIAPIRNSYFQLTGAYEMSFQNDKDAVNFIKSSMQKHLGGNKLEFKFLPKSHEIKPRAPFNHLRDSGKSIVICGLPKSISVDQIRELISDSPGNQQSLWKNIFELPIAGASTVHSKCLIVLKSKNEAYRLVRKLHNHYFAKESNGRKYQLKVKVAY